MLLSAANSNPYPENVFLYVHSTTQQLKPTPIFYVAIHKAV
jgi:hypothetical protein